MSVKIHLIKSGEVKASESGKAWLLLKDAEDKEHRIFQSVKRGDGSWEHLDQTKFDALKNLIETGGCKNRAIELTKEKVGNFWNVIDFNLVESKLKEDAVREVSAQMADDKSESMAASYGKDLLVGKVITPDSELGKRTLDWITKHLPSISTLVGEAKKMGAEVISTEIRMLTPEQKEFIMANQDFVKKNWTRLRKELKPHTDKMAELYYPEAEAIIKEIKKEGEK